MDNPDLTQKGLFDGAEEPEITDPGECLPHTPIVVQEDEGATGFIWIDPVTGEPGIRPGSGVVSGSGSPQDPYVIQGWCLPVPGILLENTKSHVILQDNTIIGTRVTEEAAVRVENATNVTITANHISQGRYGIGIWRSSDIIVQDNQVHETHEHGIWVAQTHGLRVRDNLLTENDHAIGFGLVEAATIERNHLHGNQVGILNAFSDSALIRSNTINSNGDGIIVREAEDVQVLDNTVKTSASTGIAFDTSPGGHAEGNHVEASAYEGIMFWYSPRSLAHDNLVTGSGYADDRSGIRFAGSSDSIASGNQILRNAHGIILDGSTGGGLTHNEIANNDGNGLWLWEAAETQGEHNTITGNRVGVVIAHDSAGIRLQENNIHGNPGGTGLDARGATDLVDARANWWGCAQGPGHEACDAVHGKADAAHPLEGPVPEAP